ncbi:MAG TPA: glycosyltransferase [Flavisolibacter sp.]|nr:glycosyltransferase [Flavisolibacter sp.]
MTIAVLLTVRNRREKTVACLQSLQRQQLPKDVQLAVHVTDDASTDGTSDAILATWPDAHVYKGNGHLFWAGGMRYTWQMAAKSAPDFYLLLNDDTILFENAIAVLLDAPSIQNSLCIGSTQDPLTRQRSYGGRKLTAKRSWRDDEVVLSKTDYLPCDVANANIMLVPKNIVAEIGILSEAYTHGLADYDYSLTARRAGFTVYVAPGFLGECVNDHGHNWKAQSTTLRQRIAYLKSPKGLAYHEYLTFIKRHFPLSYPSSFVKLWMKTFFPFIWETFRSK